MVRLVADERPVTPHLLVAEQHVQVAVAIDDWQGVIGPLPPSSPVFWLFQTLAASPPRRERWHDGTLKKSSSEVIVDVVHSGMQSGKED